jgi:hypothetical protein
VAQSGLRVRGDHGPLLCTEREASGERTVSSMDTPANLSGAALAKERPRPALPAAGKAGISRDEIRRYR